METYKINSHNSGFYTVIRPDGITHNMSEKMVARLKEEGKKFVEMKIVEAPTFIEPKSDDIIIDKVEKDEKKELMKLRKDDLVELARRNGFDGEIDDDITKMKLVEFILNN